MCSSDLGGNPILSFPELDQPGLFVIVKINGFCVEDHVHGWCGLIVKPAIAKGFLPCIGPGGEDILPGIVIEAERFGKLTQQLGFITPGHMGDTADDPFFSIVVQNQKKNEYK